MTSLPYQTKSAVLFLIFNRPDTTGLVFEQIRLAKPTRLYVAADGPRAGRPAEAVLCAEAKAMVKVDWDCEVKTLYRAENLGCRNGVSAAIDWFFSQEEEGIILEDDCLPANSFFRFCDTLLDKYRHDTRIRHITGCNLQHGKKWGDASYYFSNRTHVWGWASWKRVWDGYDINLTKYAESEVTEKLANIYDDAMVVDSWVNIFKESKAGKINSWAYPLDFLNFFNNSLVIIPNANLVSNIGFMPGATNTISTDDVFANIPLSEIYDIVHPVFFVPEKKADLHIINLHFKIAEKWRRYNSPRRKIKRWLKSAFGNG